MFRATALEKALQTPAELWYKAEFLSPPGSHKLNTALAQIYFAKKEGATRVVTETGAGQWGSAVAYAAVLLGIKATVYWVRAVHDWKQERLTFMKDLFGAEVFASPSLNTEIGRRELEQYRQTHHLWRKNIIDQIGENYQRDLQRWMNLSWLKKLVIPAPHPSDPRYIAGIASRIKQEEKRRRELGLPINLEDCLHPGSLSIAISEGLEDAACDSSSRYVLGSVLNHVLLHQTIIGLETKRQLEKVYGKHSAPDIVISCLGGGSNFGGIALPFMQNVLKGWNDIRFIIAQSAAAPNISQGEYRYDHADHAEKTPQFKALTLGHKKEMPPIKADGIRYHMVSPLLSFLIEEIGLIDRTHDVYTYPADELDVFERAKLFIQTEGWIPAPESCYSIAAAIDEAIKCREAGERKVIVFNISGHGLLDLAAFSEKFRELKEHGREMRWLYAHGIPSDS